MDQLCRHLAIKQRIFRSRSDPVDLLKIVSWVKESSDARGALLHAIAMQDITSQMPLNCTQAFWMPLPIFAVSVIHAIFRLSGTSSVSVPSHIHWQSTLLDQGTGPQNGNDGQSPACKKTMSFLVPDSEAPSYARGPARNLPFDVKKLQSTLHSLADQWGVSSEMEEIVMRLEKAGHTMK